MPALCFDGQAIAVRDRPPCVRAPGEARIQPLLCGICATDLEIAQGYMGFRGVLGHEFVGRVIETDDVTLLGARVVGHINCGCGRCDFCLSGHANHCPNRTVLGILGRDGVFQDSFMLPARNLVRVPEQVSDEAAVFAEPVAAACRVLEQVDVQPWQRVAVIGDGRLGLLIAMVLAGKVHSVTLFGHHPRRVSLPIAVEERALGPTTRREFEVVVEATGSPEGLKAAFAIVRPLGRVVLKTTCAAPHQLSLAPVVIDEITVVGSRCGPIDKAIEKLADGTVQPAVLVHDRFPLARADAALRRAAEPGVLKVLIEGDHRR